MIGERYRISSLKPPVLYSLSRPRNRGNIAAPPSGNGSDLHPLAEAGLSLVFHRAARDG